MICHTLGITLYKHIIYNCFHLQCCKCILCAIIIIYYYKGITWHNIRVKSFCFMYVNGKMM